MNPGNPADRLQRARRGVMLWGSAGIALPPLALTVLFVHFYRLDAAWLKSGAVFAGLLIVVGCGYLRQLYLLNRVLWRELLPTARLSQARGLAFLALLPGAGVVLPLVLAYRQKEWLVDRPARRNLTLAWLGFLSPLTAFLGNRLLFFVVLFFIFAVMRLAMSQVLAANGRFRLETLGIVAAPEPGWRRWLHRSTLLVLWLMIAGMPAIWIAFNRYAAKADITSTLALLRQNAPLTSDRLQEKYPAPNADGRGIGRKLFAAWPYVRPEPGDAPLEAFDRLQPLAVPSETPLPPEAEPWLAQLRKERFRTGELLDQLPDCPEYDFHREWERGADMPLTGLTELRRLALLERFRIAEALAQRDRIRILELWRQYDILADWAAQDGTLLSGMVNSAITMIELSTCEPVFGQMKFSDAELVELIGRLERRETRIPPMIRRALDGELVLAEVMLRQLQTGQPGPAPGYPEFIRSGLTDFPLRALFRLNRADFHMRMAMLLAICERPYYEIRPILAEITDVPRNLSTLFTQQYFAAWNRGLSAFAESIASLRCVRTGLAAELYRRKYGRRPGRIADLVPEFLPEIPLDPFNGEPLRIATGELFRFRPDYRIDGPNGEETFSTEWLPESRSGFRIYSVGPDRTDDGGAPKMTPYRRGEPYDITFSWYDRGED